MHQVSEKPAVTQVSSLLVMQDNREQKLHSGALSHTGSLTPLVYYDSLFFSKEKSILHVVINEDSVHVG